MKPVPGRFFLAAALSVIVPVATIECRADGVTDTGRNPAQLAAAAATGPFAEADRLALSGDVQKIRLAIKHYERLAATQPPEETAWRLSRAWFNLYDELPRPEENAARKEAARRGERIARSRLEQAPDDTRAKYWLAMNLLARADLEGAMTFLGNVREILRKIREVQKEMPDIDDGGPDRMLAIFLHELPWPWGDDDASYEHIQRALAIAPYRCANHDLAARLYLELEEKDRADASIRKLETGSCTSSSPMWEETYRQHGAELRSAWRKAFEIEP